jgi:predicted type IV restriction endonuclease
VTCSQKYKHQLGTVVRCPKCKSVFTLELIDPTPLGDASLEEADTQEEPAETSRKSKRRTKAEIRQELIDNIREGFKRLHPRLTEIANAPKSSEEEVRRWCLAALETALGYDHNEIDTEMSTLNGRVDIALKKDGQVFLVIECKNIRSRLNEQAKKQAAGYATSLSSHWAVVTNGQIWRLYRVIPQPGKDPRFIEVFDVALLDEDGVSDVDAENLYLLTSRAVFGGDLEKMSHFIACTSKKRILKAMSSERVIKALRVELAATYKEDQGTSVSLDDESVDNALQDALGLRDL